MSLDAKPAVPNLKSNESSQLRAKITQDFRHQEIGYKTTIQLASIDPIIPQEKKRKKMWPASRVPEKINSDSKFHKIGRNSLIDAIAEADSEKALNREIRSNLWQKLVQYLKNSNKDNQPIFFPEDEIAVSKDEESKPCLIFRRDGKAEIIRP